MLYARQFAYHTALPTRRSLYPSLKLAKRPLSLLLLLTLWSFLKTELLSVTQWRRPLSLLWTGRLPRVITSRRTTKTLLTDPLSPSDVVINFPPLLSVCPRSLASPTALAANGSLQSKVLQKRSRECTTRSLRITTKLTGTTPVVVAEFWLWVRRL